MVFNDILDNNDIPQNDILNPFSGSSASGKHVVHSYSGGAAKAVGLFQSAKVCIERKEKPTMIVGTSSGSLVAPIVAASYIYPDLIDKAIQFAETLDVIDMFPYVGNKPFTKGGKIPLSAKLRALTGHNHLGWQDIRPLYKKVFKDIHLTALKESGIKCFSFSVLGKNGMPEFNFLNNAKSVDELIDLIERSSRITPIVQNKDGRIDGGFISFSPGMWVLDKDAKNIKEYIAIYSHPIKVGIGTNKNWDDNIFSVAQRMIEITTYYLGYKDAKIEELICEKHGIQYTRIECPDGIVDEIYEDDDHQLIAFGKASREAAILAIQKHV